MKPFGEFYRMKANKHTGLGPWCKPCMNVVRDAHYEANKDHARQTRRKWHENNPDKVRASRLKRQATSAHKAYMAVYGREWYANNKDRLKAVRAEWYRRNKPQVNARTKAYYSADSKKWNAVTSEWAKAHPEQMRAYTACSDAKRRAAKVKSSGQFSARDIEALKRLQKGRCAICRVVLGTKFHRDHIVSLSAGGSNDKHNIQLLCQPCNQHKHAKDPIAFMQSRGYLL